jgi:hypothetical protein
MLLLLERTTWILTFTFFESNHGHLQLYPPRTAGDGHEREVARGLANDLKRRIEKKEMNQRKKGMNNLMLRMWGILLINATNDGMKRFRVASYNEDTEAITQNFGTWNAL